MLQFLGTGVEIIRNISYFTAYIAYSMYKISLGPLIPYLAEEAHKVETQYSFLFICRAAGMLVGAALLHKYQNWPSRPSRHKMLALSLAFIIVTNFCFLWSKTPFFQGFWNFLSAIHFFFVELLIDLSIISLGKNIDQLFLLVTACFGIGSLASPILVRILGLNSYYVFAIIAGVLIPLFLYLPSPEINKEDNKVQTSQTSKQKMTLNPKTVNLLCAAYFIYLGLLIAKLAWSSSYSVMACDLTKQQATIFPSINAGSNTITKFVWLFVPIKGSNRLRLTTQMLVVVSIISMVLTSFVGGIQALVFDSICMGIFMSPICPLILSIGSEFGRPLTENQTSKIMTWGVIGEGVLTMLYGNLMEKNSNIYFYFSIFLCLALWYFSSCILDELKGGKKEEKQLSLLEMQTIA